MRRAIYHTALLLATSSCFVFVGPRGADEARTPAELPPLASAGADRQVLRGFPVRLDGGGTTHPLGLRFTVLWEQIDGDRVQFSNPAEISPSFLTPTEEQTLRFRITADDGTWVTEDEVAIHVVRSPDAVAPRVTAGPDRILDRAQSPQPAPSDIRDVPADATSDWEPVIARDESGVTAKEGAISAHIFRLKAERDGLESSGDFLLLHRFQEALLGERAPVVTVSGPGVVEPGGSYVLDARDSSDPNGDPLTFRWEQLRGEPLPNVDGNRRVEGTAPTHPQELLFRVFARDDLLESAPAAVSVVVQPATGVAPIASPVLDLRGHATNEILLDAFGASSMDPGALMTFVWQQTFGVQVPLSADTTGRFATFTASAAPSDLVFAVVATEDALDSAPVVTRVEVVDLSDNFGPDVYVCASSLTPKEGEWVVVSATVVDPEFDALNLNTIDWFALTTPVRPSFMLETRDMMVVPPGTLCEPPDTPPHPAIEFFEKQFVAPTADTQVDVTVEIRDEHGELGTGIITVIAQP